MEKMNYHVVYLILLFSTIFIPSFGTTDTPYTHWIYLSIINALYFITSLINQSSITLIKNKKLDTAILFYLCYLIWASLSILYSINPAESFINSSKISITFFSIIILYNIINRVKFKTHYVLIGLIILMIIETLYSMYGFFYVIDKADYQLSFSNIFMKGLTGNKNITAASIAFKLPFLFYFLLISKNKFLRLILIILASFICFNLMVLSSRAILVSFLACFIFILLIPLINANFKKHILKYLIIFILPFIIGFITTKFYINPDSNISLNNRVSSVTNYQDDESASTRLRYYKGGLEEFFRNPIISNGTGTWKIFSIRLDKEYINSYVVPYVAHNDFIEVLAEIGIIGFLLYVGFYFQLIRVLFINLKKVFSKKDIVLIISVSQAFIIYLVDANLNFPQYRPIMIICILSLFMIVKKIEIDYAKN